MTSNQLATSEDIISSLLALGKITEKDIETAKRYAIPQSLRDLCLEFATIISEEGDELLSETQLLQDFSGELAKKWLSFTSSFIDALNTKHKYETINTLLHQATQTPQVTLLINFIYVAADIFTFSELIECLIQLADIPSYTNEEQSDVPVEVSDQLSQSVSQDQPSCKTPE